MHSLNAERVYTKTETGREEVARRQYGLSARQRQLLIIFDGSRRLGEVRKLVVHATFHEDVDALLRAAFIVPRGAEDAAIDQEAQGRTGASSEGASVRQSKQVFSDNEPHQSDRLSSLKEFMAGAAQAHLGLLGASLVDYIERADDLAKLALVVGQWHLALRESKRGGPLADSYLQQVRTALHGQSPAECPAA